MGLLSGHFRRLDARYKGPEGDRFAAEELTPVAARFCPPRGSVLEVGCGYGRNLLALARIDAGIVVGCDPSAAQLARARSERVGALAGAEPPVALVRQAPFGLPFREASFDLVVLWQVLEHLIGPDAKPRVLAECVRVLRPGGHLLVETPNHWFPVDYHDNKLPLVHWLLPAGARRWLTRMVRGDDYPPSEYVSLPGLERLLRAVPGVVGIRKMTRVYFAEHYGDAWRGLSGTQVGLKRVLFALLAPVHLALAPFGGSADLFLPSLRVVYRVDR